MIFSSIEFLVFFAFCLAFYWCVLGQFRGSTRLRLQHVFLLVASYYFYVSWNAYLVVLILFSTLVDYIAGLAIRRTSSALGRKVFLVISLSANLGLLGLFKYNNFFLGNANAALGFLGWDTHFVVTILLPVGISFYTLQSMSYTIDVYRGRLEPIANFVDFALYVSFFPQLVAGPIVRATHFLPQLESPKRFSDVNVFRGINYFLLGLVKKVLISDWLSIIVDGMFANPSAYDSVGVWVGMIAYAVQIYCDFSGYSDMAIGAAGLMGYDIPPNFRMPYLATNIPELWRRWHISLSSWLRDYLYIPLGGNRGSRLFTYRNIMITMLLGGLWHGANWRFVIWGGMHGAALIVHREFTRRFPPGLKPARSRAVAGCVATFLFFDLALVFFRAETMTAAWTIVKRMAFFENAGIREVPCSFWVLTGLTVLGHALGAKYFARFDLGDKDAAPWPAYACAYAIVIFALLLFAPDGSQPFIYFQF